MSAWQVGFVTLYLIYTYMFEGKPYMVAMVVRRMLIGHHVFHYITRSYIDIEKPFFIDILNP